jgi:NAD(P)-dependent dehydrogenase (short-subunit alcohol dehydrogenase family)
MPESAWRLDEQVILVTGSSGGIGRAVVDALGAAGARVSVCDFTHPDDLAGEALQHSGDLADPSVAVDWVAATLDRFGRVDGLVNVAGIWRSAPFESITASALAEVIAANFLSTWNTCQAVVPHMAAAGSGAIVNFASTAGQFGSIRPAAHYAASKGAVIALTKSLAREVSPLGIRVNAISPGPIDTSSAGSGVAFDDTEVAQRTLLRRAGRPDEIANGVLYLVSAASSFATGSVLNVNGGSLL